MSPETHDPGIQNHDQLSGVSSDQHHAQNHDNADHSTRMLEALASSDRTDVTSNVSFGSWRQPDANNPVLVTTVVQTIGVGGNRAQIDILVDEDGDDTAEHTYSIVSRVFGNVGNPDIRNDTTTTILLAAGEQYQIANSNDPDTSNSIQTVTETIL